MTTNQKIRRKEIGVTSKPICIQNSCQKWGIGLYNKPRGWAYSLHIASLYHTPRRKEPICQVLCIHLVNGKLHARNIEMSGGKIARTTYSRSAYLTRKQWDFDVDGKSSGMIKSVVLSILPGPGLTVRWTIYYMTSTSKTWCSCFFASNPRNVDFAVSLPHALFKLLLPPKKRTLAEFWKSRPRQKPHGWFWFTCKQRNQSLQWYVYRPTVLLNNHSQRRSVIGRVESYDLRDN